MTQQFEMTKEAAELTKIASNLISFGAEMAMAKIAEVDKKEEEEEEEEKEGDVDEETKKEAAAAGAFAAEGFLQKLANAGAENYGDENYYFRALALERGLYEKVASAFGEALRMSRTAPHVTTMGEKLRSVGQAAKSHLKDVGIALNHPATYAGAGGAALGAGAGAIAGGPDHRLSGAAMGAGAGAALGAGAGFAGQALYDAHLMKNVRQARQKENVARRRGAFSAALK